MPVRIPGPKPRVENDPLEEFWDNMVDALQDIPIRILIGIIGIVPVVGQPIANALADWLLDTNEKANDAIETVVSVGTQVNYVQQVIALQSGMGVYETGPDRTGTPSFPFGLLNLSAASISISGGTHAHSVSGSTGSTSAGGDFHNHGSGSLNAPSANSGHSHTVTVNVPTVAATAAYAPWATVIFKSAAERKVLTWLAYKTGSVDTFHLDVYRLEADGSSTYTGYSSPNLAGELATTIGWMQHLMSGASVIADNGDMYEVQFRMTGTGTVFLAGVNFPNPTPLPGFRPYASGAGRNPSTTPTPSTISTATRDAMYTGPCAFVSFGIDVGQTVLPRFFFDDFNRSSLGTRWITYGNIGIADNKVEYTGSVIANATAAAMYHQPLASDYVEVAADISINNEDVGIGVCCTSSLGAGVWLIVEDGGVWLDTGAYNSRTNRASASLPGAGRYFLTCTRPDESSPYTFRVHFGSIDNAPIISWTDTGNVVAHGLGRRWWGVLARRNGLINPSGRLDNVTARDITTEEP